jgi:tetratricopeptide (TPR) repeat protein
MHLMAALKIFSRIAGDPQKLAETYEREGKKGKAAEQHAKAGNYRRAAELAAEVQDEAALVRYSLMAAFGKVPPGQGDLNARQAGDLLAGSGRYAEAVPLFELAGDYRRAAVAAAKIGDGAQAGRMYEKAKMWPEAASHYDQAGLFQDALRILDAEARSLARGRTGSGPPGGRLEEVHLKRAELLLQLGRSAAAFEILKPLPDSLRRAQLFERSGRSTEAIDAYLDAGDGDRALALARKSPDQARRVARVHLRSGRPAQAAQIFDSLGLKREAAEAYEAAQDWLRAAYLWGIVQEPARAGETYRKAGKPREAARCFRAAGQTREAAELHVQAGDLGDAAALYIEIGDLLTALSLYLRRGDLNQALATCRKLPAGPDLLAGALLVAPKLVTVKRPADALQILEAAAAAPAEGKSLLDRLYWEGRALEDLERFDEARARYGRVRETDLAHRDAARRYSNLDLFADAPARPVPGVTIGQRLAHRYEILAELGRGGMGKVYKARDVDLGELVAIKTLLSTEDSRVDEERLLREVQICRRVTHPNVVRVFDLGRFDGGIFITMELLEGQVLEELIAKEGPQPLERVRFFLSGIAAGLQEAHLLGIVHRDLKPSNIMVTERHLKILDFGIASMVGFDSRLTQPGIAVGSPMYMSPEQLQGQPLDGRSDLYSLGILAYALIAGREPFQNENMTVLALQHVRDEVPDIRQFRPYLPAPWVEMLARLLAKEPAERYSSARQVLQILAALPTD